jgi:hypothetical protein
MDNLIEKHMDNISIDKVGALFGFVVKAAYPMSEESLRRLLLSFKKHLITNLSTPTPIIE